MNNYKDGGSFGAIVEKGEKIVGRGHNTVILSKDPSFLDLYIFQKSKK